MACAHESALLPRRVLQDRAHTEIRNLYLSSVVDQQVCRFQVTVDDVLLMVEAGQTPEYLHLRRNMPVLLEGNGR